MFSCLHYTLSRIYLSRNIPNKLCFSVRWVTLHFSWLKLLALALRLVIDGMNHRGSPCASPSELLFASVSDGNGVLLSDQNCLLARRQQIGFFQAGINGNGGFVRARDADDAQCDTAHLIDHRADLIIYL